MHMHSEFPPLCGRDHLRFRSYYFPVKNVIDGDLCEQFNSTDPHKQKSVAEELDRTLPEVSKKMEDIQLCLLEPSCSVHAQIHSHIQTVIYNN
uniref:RSE1/DDB1/CPSF1 C-terminal domain-containing protein n=1 Tax=Hucho hucho TaxID=62062 RepID=A0A4W5MA66_9TELE